MSASSKMRDGQHYCSFYVGQKVVCIDTSPGELDHSSSGLCLELGAVYTITKIECFRVPAVQVAEFVMTEYGYEYYMRASRFRPVTDISVFEGMLKSAPADNQRRLRELEREGV